MSRESLKSLSPWFQMPRNFFLEMGGVNNQEYVRKRGVSIKRTCAYEGRGGSNFSQFRAYVLIE